MQPGLGLGPELAPGLGLGPEPVHGPETEVRQYRGSTQQPALEAAVVRRMGQVHPTGEQEEHRHQEPDKPGGGHLEVEGLGQ